MKLDKRHLREFSLSGMNGSEKKSLNVNNSRQNNVKAESEPDKARASQLLAEAKNGNVDAFAELFESSRAKLHRVAYRLVGANDCDDVVMETYLKAWRSLKTFRGSAALSTWLCRIAHNCSLDFLRKRTREQGRLVTQFIDPETDRTPMIERVSGRPSAEPDAAALRNDAKRIVAHGLQLLSDDHRVVLQLREIDGLSYKEIAAATGSSVGTVMSRLFYARRKLKKVLESENLWQT